MANKDKQESVATKPEVLTTDNNSELTHKIPVKSKLNNQLAIIIALLGLIGAGYSYFINQHTYAQLEYCNKHLLTQVKRLQQKQNEQGREARDKANSLTDANLELSNQIQNLNYELKSIQQQGAQGQDWLILKARYYLELAEINAHWMSYYDPSTENLLQQADNVLAQINSPRLFKVRQIIAEELLQLKSQPRIDLAGLLSQLDALQHAVTQLQSTILIQNAQTTAPQEQPPLSSAPWSNYVHHSLEILSKLVVIRRNNEEIKPLLSPIYETLIKESIRLNLQEAQIALLNHNSQAYHLALKQALTTIKRVFNIHLTPISLIIEQINELQQVTLTTKPIAVGKALPLINKLIEEGVRFKSPETEEASHHD